MLDDTVNVPDVFVGVEAFTFDDKLISGDAVDIVRLLSKPLFTHRYLAWYCGNNIDLSVVNPIDYR